MIYDYALVVICPVRPYYLSECHRLGLEDVPSYYRNPSVNLLASCRTVYAEAYPIAYTRNHFFLPFGEFTSRFFANALHNPLRRSWIRSVTLAFTQFDLSDEERMGLEKMRCELVNKASHLSLRSTLLKEKVSRLSVKSTQHRQETSLVKAGKDLHSISRDLLVSVAWPRKARFVLECLKLDTLQIKIKDSYCPEHCCYIPECALASLTMGFASEMPGEIRADIDNKSQHLQKSMKEWTEIQQRTSIPLSLGMKTYKTLIKKIAQYESNEGRWSLVPSNTDPELHAFSMLEQRYR
jgi:hypothetical protein